MSDVKIYLSGPDITQAEIDAVIEVMQSRSLSLGPKLPEFEKAFMDYTGRKYAVAVNSGTSGLYLCLKAMGIGEGDEVITTPFTFIASATTIMMTGAKPVFVDIDPENLNINPDLIEAAITRHTKAIMPVEVFGNPARFDNILAVAQNHNLPILEDCCEALGSQLNGRMAGTFGIAGVFAFYPNKQITTGEGGMIVTDDEDLADVCRSMRNQGRGKSGGWLAHERLGYNYRLSDINCAMGVVQMSRIEEIVAKRKRVADTYLELLANEDRIILPKEPENSRMSWFVFVIRLKDSFTSDQRDAVIGKMYDRGIQVSNYFQPVHLQPFIAEQYGCKEGDFPVTDQVCKRTIALPFYNNLPDDQIAEVCRSISECIDEVS